MERSTTSRRQRREYPEGLRVRGSGRHVVAGLVRWFGTDEYKKALFEKQQAKLPRYQSEDFRFGMGFAMLMVGMALFSVFARIGSPDGRPDFFSAPIWAPAVALLPFAAWWVFCSVTKPKQ